MRLTPLMLLLANIAIAGCASHPADCGIGSGHNRCVPGTKEYEEMQQKQQDAKTTEEIDDARCQTYGARGTAAYVTCRRRATEDHQMLNTPR